MINKAIFLYSMCSLFFEIHDLYIILYIYSSCNFLAPVILEYICARVKIILVLIVGS